MKIQHACLLGLMGGLVGSSSLTAHEPKSTALQAPRKQMTQDAIVRCVVFSPDGKTLAAASDDKTIRLWDVATGQQRASLKGHTDWVWSLAYSPDGKTLASVSKDTTIKLWDVQTGKERATLMGHTDWQCAVAFSPDGKTLAEGSKDRTIKLWDVRTVKLRSTLKWRKDWLAEQVAPLPKEEAALAYSPDGKTLASENVDKTLHLWDVETGKVRATLNEQGLRGGSNRVAYSPDGKTLASTDGGGISLWDVKTGKKSTPLMGGVSCMAFSPDGKTLASAGENKTIIFWDVRTGKERATLTEDTNWGVTCVAFSPDGKTLATATGHYQSAKPPVSRWLGTIKLWDVSKSKETDTRQNDVAALEGHWAAVSYSGDGEVGIVGGKGGYIPSVEAFKTGKLILKPNRKLKLDPNEWSREEFHEGKLIVEDSFTGFRVDPSCQPKAIDFFLRDVDGNEVSYRGIYELKGNTLRICRTVTPNGPRPAEFKAEKGSKAVLAAWRREKCGDASDKSPERTPHEKKPADRNDKEKATDTIIRPVVILIDVKTKGIPAGAKIKETDVPKETIAKKALRDVKSSKGRMAGFDREYAIKSAKITLADDTVVECNVLLSADELERMIIKNVQRAGQVLEATSDEGAGKWIFCTGEYKIAIDPSKDRPAKQRDTKALQGQWRVVESAIIGPTRAEKNPANEVRKHKVFVSGDKLTYEFNNQQHDKHEGTILLDPKRNWIDWTQTAGGTRIGTMLGIYEIKGDDVRLFFGVDGMLRPRGFDNVGWLLVFKREQPKEDSEKKEALNHSNDAFAALINGDYDKAITQGTEAIRLDPKSVMAYLNRGSAYVLKGEPDKAIKDFDRVIQLDSKDVRGYDNRAAAYANKGDYRKAVEDYREAMRVGPEKYAPSAYLADLLATCPDRRLRDGKKAVELATKACKKTKWNDFDSLSALAAAYAEVGDFKKAVEWHKKAMKANGTLIYPTKQQQEESRQRLKCYEEGKPYRRRAVEDGKRAATNGDKGALQGTWCAVAGENSKEKFDKELKSIRLVFQGDKLTLRFGGDALHATYKLDPSRKPKAIDLISTGDRAKGKAILGIYTLEGGELKLCFSESGQERPTEFAAEGKPGLRTLLVFRHEAGDQKRER